MDPEIYALPIGGDEENPDCWVPSQRVFMAYGSITYEENFYMLEWYLNFIKNRVSLPILCCQLRAHTHTHTHTYSHRRAL
jgi:hypothetical protein